MNPISLANARRFFSARRLQAAVTVGTRALMEQLESRRLLSVALSSIIGDRSSGAERHYQLSSGDGSVQSTEVQIIGDTKTFNGHDAVETVSTITSSTSPNTSTFKDYTAVTDDGYIEYGSLNKIVNTATGDVLQDDQDVYSPPLRSFTRTFEAGVPVTSNTATETETDFTQTPNTTSTSTETVSVTLVSETTQSLTVAAGTFNVYELTETDTTDNGIDEPSTSTITLFTAPHVGIVKIVGPDGAFVQELSSFNGDDGGDGGGGGGVDGTVILTPTVTNKSLPEAVVSGTAVKGNVTVSVANTGDTTSDGSTTVELFASTTGGIEDGATPIATSTKNLKVTTAKPAEVGFSIKDLTLDAGTYQLFARVTAPDGAVTDSAAGPTITVAPAFVDLAATFAISSPKPILPGKTVKGKLTVTNNGNVAVNQSVDASFSSGTNADGSGAAFISTLSENVKLAAGKSKSFNVSYKVPVGTVPQDYYFVVDVDPTNTLSDPNTSDNTAITPTPLTVLDPYPDIVASFSGTVGNKKGPDKGISADETLEITSEDPTSGAIVFTVTYTASDGGTTTDTGTGTITTKGAVTGTFASGITIKGKLSKQTLKGTHLDPDGDTGPFSLTKIVPV